jgi:uncharacterized protein
MAVFLDTGFYFALLAEKDENHERSKEILVELVDGHYGAIYTSDYVLDEAMTLINARTHGNRKDLLEKMQDYFLNDEPIAQLVNINHTWLSEIGQLQLTMTAENNPVSFTDASNVIACQRLEIPQIVAFDGHYHGYLNQIH